MRHIIQSLPEALLPRLCPVCGRSLVRGERALCMHCLMGLPRTRMYRDPDNSIVARLARPGLRLTLAAAWMEYRRESPYAAIVRDAKYRHMPRLAREAGRLFASEMKTDGVSALADIDVLLPVPMHWTKLMRRGYNQSEEIARGVAAVTGLPVATGVVERIRDTESQTRKTDLQRVENVEGAFRLTRPDRVAGRHVLIVDDVVTTGSTVCACGRELMRAGGVSVSVMSLGFTHQ